MVRAMSPVAGALQAPTSTINARIAHFILMQRALSGQVTDAAAQKTALTATRSPPRRMRSRQSLGVVALERRSADLRYTAVLASGMIRMLPALG
jgi:hypothetical protein